MRIGCGVLVVAALVLILAMLWGRMGVYAGGSDSSGYANNAKLILKGRLFAEQRRIWDVTTPLSDFTFIPLGFIPRGESQMVPAYPLGLSALFAAASVGTSLDFGMTLAIWLMAAGSLVVTYLLARQQGLGRGWAVLCAGILAACPLFLFMAQQAMSDMPAMLWTTVALVLAWASRRRAWLAVVAGLAVAMAVFIRPSNILIFLPLVLALGWDWRRWLWLGLGGAPGGVLWLMTNHMLFGRYVATGYGSVGELFGWQNVLPTLRNYAEVLPWLLPLGLFGLFSFSWRRRTAEQRTAWGMAATWVLACMIFYAFYRYTHETWWYLRFIIPAFPALIVLSVLGLRWAYMQLRGSAGRPAWREAMAVAALLLAILGGLCVQLAAVQRRHALDAGIGERAYPEACEWVRRNLPADSVVFTMQMSGALFYAGPQVVVRWDSLDIERSGAVCAAAGRAGRQVFAVFFPFEVEEAFGRKLAGRWTRIGNVRQITIWRLADPTGTMP